MKNRGSEDFRQLRLKIFLRTTAMIAIAAAGIYGAYTFLLRGHFAELMLSVFQRVFGMDYDAALSLYQRTFRSHMDAVIWLAILVLFLTMFHVCLRWFTGYFEAAGRGLDAILREEPGEISLPPELAAIERKMNAAKHTLERQKSDMRAAEQRKNDLVMYLAHDLKTPLASAVGYLHLLHDEKEISEETREKYLSVALTKAERLEDLINEFLEIARYNLSHVSLQYSEIDLTRLLEQLAYEFRPILEERGLTCRLEAADSILFKCDAGRLQRLFDNLLRNAVLYSDAGSEITITSRQGAEGLILEFSNRGATIPREKLERIFDQFYRLDAGRGSEGAGLGLAIAKQIAELHGGTITAESENGLTVFTVTLPAP